MRRGVTAAVGLRLALTAVFLAAAGCGAPGAPGADVGERLPGFDLPALHGGSVQDRDLAGDRPVILNFWATWCGPCVREIPVLNALHREGAVRVVSISVDEEEDEVVRAFAAAEGIEYPVLLGDLGTVQRFGGAVLPYTLIVDGELTVREVHRGLVSRRTLDRSLSALDAPG